MTIPKAIAYSPHTTLTSGFDSTVATTCEVVSLAAFPDVAAGEVGVIVLCAEEDFRSVDPADFETMTYTAKNAITGALEGLVHREGTARVWPAGTYVACYGTAYAWEEMRMTMLGHIAEDETDDVHNIATYMGVHEAKDDTDNVHGYKTYTDGMIKGFKNAIINGDFRVNQRVHTSGGTLAAGAYGHDRWKAGADGCNYTFSTTANKTTITIPATKELLQIIEGDNLVSGGYTLSWEGTAQAKIGVGSYADSPIAANVTGGANLTITFGAGTVANVQFEKGSVATPFEQRPIGLELNLCQRYFQTVGSGNYAQYRCSTYTANLLTFVIPIAGKMRTTPTLGGSTAVYNMSVSLQSGFSVGVDWHSPGAIKVMATKTSHGLTDGILQVVDQTLDAEI